MHLTYFGALTNIAIFALNYHFVFKILLNGSAKSDLSIQVLQHE